MKLGLGLMGLTPDAFWRHTLKEWLLRSEGWASQYPEPETPPTEEEHEELVSGLTPEQREWLGIKPAMTIRTDAVARTLAS